MGNVTVERKLLDVLADYNLTEVSGKYRREIKTLLADDCWSEEQKKEEIEQIIICVCCDKLTKLLTKELGDEEEAKLYVMGFFVLAKMTGKEWVKLAKYPDKFLPPFRRYRAFQLHPETPEHDKILRKAMDDILEECGVIVPQTTPETT
jgi:hypothetical protein